MINKMLEMIKKYNMIEKGDRIVVGVSGGPDSVALLYLLNSLKQKYNLSLHVAHINYHLRGNESNQDESD